MGRTMKWLKGILGINKEKHQKPNSGVRQSCLGHSVREPIIESTDDDSLICQNPHTIPPNLTPAEAAWLKSFYSESDQEQQSRHAIAVAAATAAAADAAVAAAHAAAAVVRLTSKGARRRSGSLVGNNGGAGGREKWGAIKIQTVFRGYLARKALRALKGLVKLQAIVRGYLVRKQADATFLSMQVLIRSAQSTIRAQRTRALINSTCQLQHPPKNSLETFDEVTSQQRNSFLHSTSKRISETFDNTNTDINAVEESPKIVEMDTGRPKSRSRRSMVSDSGDENNEDDDCASSHHTQSSTCPYHPPRLSIPEWQHSDSLEEHNHKWGDDCRGYTTAQSTPRFATNCCGNNSSPVITPAKSVCVESLFRNYGNYCPSYMADTQSFKAKLRSQSAPKQRPEQYPAGTKRRQSIHEMMGSRNSLSGVKMQRSCSNAQEAINFKNAVISKLGRSTEFVRDQCTRDY